MASVNIHCPRCQSAQGSSQKTENKAR
ncbi:hypothetical protein HV198_23690 (plasmid) [Citrobacter freundii]|nr:hypothetical protein HV215_25190 [Citrobacter freundii]QLV43435.1 hypothetical protein HV198_23690 [Citrobacter freundii]